MSKITKSFGIFIFKNKKLLSAKKPIIISGGGVFYSKIENRLKETEKYMCDKHLVFFKIKLTEWKKELVKANNEALYHGSMDDNSVSADVVDQASSYTDKAVENEIY